MRRPVVFVACLFLTGCLAGNVNQQNFDRLRVGMTPPEVERIMGSKATDLSADQIDAVVKEHLAPADGKPAALPDMTGAKGKRYGSESKSITVIYLGDRVARVFKKGF